MITVSYAHTISFVGNRPFVDIKIMPSHSNAVIHKCLVDTGADYLQLPALAATSVGISLAGISATSVSTASGTTSMLLCPSVDVEIEGGIVKVDVLFDMTNSASLLAGRALLLAAFNIGFDPSNWYHA